MAAAMDHLTALIALLKTYGGQDKLYKVMISYCKLLVVYNIAQKKGPADKVQKALDECRTIMRLGGWLGGNKDIYSIAKAKKMSLPIVLELICAVCGTIYNVEDNLNFLHGKGVVSINTARNQNSANFYQFWNYVFSALAAWFGKDGYLESVAAAKKAKAAGDLDTVKAAKGKATKALLKVTHHSLDTLGNLAGMDYIPAFKPPPSFSAVCGLASGAVVCYVQYNDQLDKVGK